MSIEEIMNLIEQLHYKTRQIQYMIKMLYDKGELTDRFYKNSMLLVHCYQKNISHMKGLLTKELIGGLNDISKD